MFEQDGLLCPHILKVFTSYDVEQIPEKYLLRRWSEEATIKISENLLSPEACFGVPATNKLIYNALCRKMSGLAADACFAPDKYKIASQGIDEVWEDVKAVGSVASMEVDECQEQRTVNTVRLNLLLISLSLSLSCCNRVGIWSARLSSLYCCSSMAIGHL